MNQLLGSRAKAPEGVRFAFVSAIRGCRAYLSCPPLRSGENIEYSGTDHYFLIENLLLFPNTCTVIPCCRLKQHKPRIPFHNPSFLGRQQDAQHGCDEPDVPREGCRAAQVFRFFCEIFDLFRLPPGSGEKAEVVFRFEEEGRVLHRPAHAAASAVFV